MGSSYRYRIEWVPCHSYFYSIHTPLSTFHPPSSYSLDAILNSLFDLFFHQFQMTTIRLGTDYLHMSYFFYQPHHYSFAYSPFLHTHSFIFPFYQNSLPLSNPHSYYPLKICEAFKGVCSQSHFLHFLEKC